MRVISFNSDQALILRTFLDMLHRDIMSDKETRDVAEQESQDAGQVTVMTVLRSKHLEFPVVILPGGEADRLKQAVPDFIHHKKFGLELNVRDLGIWPSAAFKQDWEQLHSHLLAEEMRLFYVVVTRAQHVIFMFGVRLHEDDKRAGVVGTQKCSRRRMI